MHIEDKRRTYALSILYLSRVITSECTTVLSIRTFEIVMMRDIIDLLKRFQMRWAA